MVKAYAFVLIFFGACISQTAFATRSISKVDRKSFSGSLKNEKVTDLDVVVTIDRLCQLGETFLTEGITLKPKKNSFSREESHTIKLPDAFTLEELEGVALYDDCVMKVSKNIRIELQGITNDPGVSKQEHLSSISYDKTFKFFFGSNTSNSKIKKDSIIAIIDNGVDINHEDLKQNLWINEKEKNGIAGVDDDGNGLIDDVYGYDFASNVPDPNHKIPGDNPIDAHGTHVAALAAAATNNSTGVAGIMAKNVKIMSLNVFGKKSYAQIADLDTAIRYAADMGANVINISLGGRGNGSSTESAIKYAISKNALVVVAAGNDGEVLSETNFFTPASFGAEIDGMITVGADDVGTTTHELCDFSNRGPAYVEIAAPGCNTLNGNGLYSAFRGNTYGYMEGTSMASPVVAGVALVAYSYLRDQFNKQLTPSQLEDYLKQSSKNFSSLDHFIEGGKCVDLQSLKDKITLDDNSN